MYVCVCVCQLADVSSYPCYVGAYTVTVRKGRRLSVVSAGISSVWSQDGDTTQQRQWQRGTGGNSEEEVDGLGHKLRVSVAASRVAEKVRPVDPVLPGPGRQLQQQ